MLWRLTNIPPEEHGMSYFEDWYDETTILDAELAKEKFSFWYDEEKYYDYSVEPSTDDIGYTGKFILQHRIFLIIFREL